MKHPSREEMMSYLYEELSPELSRALEQHLADCAECQASFAEWRGTQRQLDAYAAALLPRPHHTHSPWTRPALAAAAVVLVLLAGFALGRLGRISSAELDARERESRAQILAATQAEARHQFEQLATEMANRVDALQGQHTRDYGALRKELETVAVLTEAGFRQTENRFVALTDNSPIRTP